MNDAAAPYGRKTQRAPKIAEVHILWITAGLGCDGDSVSITAASEPSIEDVLLGAIPGLPKVHLHNPVLAYTKSATSLCSPSIRRRAANWTISSSSSRARSQTKTSAATAIGRPWAPTPHTGQPIKTTDWIDRLAPKALAVIGAGTCATFGGIHAMKGNPTGCMGLSDFLGWDWKSKAGLPIVNVPGCPFSPTISWRPCFICCASSLASRP